MLKERISLHELNNALTVIAGATQQLDMRLHETTDDYLRNKIATLQQAVSRAMQITRRSGWEFAKTDNKVVDIAAPVLEMRGVLSMIVSNAELCIDAVPGCLAVADLVEVEGILINLVKNAVESLDRRGRISVTVKSEKCNTICSTCGTHVKGMYAVIEVSDNGRGIPPEKMNSIFEHDYTTKKGGHGLGLYNLRIKTHLMGGHVTVASSPVGTTFKIYLINANRVTAEPKVDYNIPAGKKAAVFAGGNGGLALIQDYLADLRIGTVDAGSCKKADFIVYDAEADNGEARAVIGRCALEHHELPVICITNYHIGESIFGDIHYLTKPFDKDAFVCTVRKALKIS